MRTLEELKGTSSWKIFSPSLKIISVLYFLKDNNTRKQIMNSSGLDEKSLEDGLSYLIDTEQLVFTETTSSRRYCLKQDEVDFFSKFYDF
jgi:hypothetical protein